jgi:2,3-dihydroxy-p-cumate/2,3-dihydroxybenzoate 3,4-dioxygenase
MGISDIRYRRLGYIGLNVSDLARSRRFYEEQVGLTVDREADDGLLFLRCSDRHHDIVLYEGGVPGVKRIGWQMESARALGALRAHLIELGIELHPVSNGEAALLGISEAFRISEPTTGATLEFYLGMDSAPAPYVPTHTKIQRLGHIVLGSADRAAAEKFFLEELNFRASDRIEGAITFLRCFPNPLHHSLGIAQARSSESCLNHINFMVSEMADVGKGNNRMKHADIPIVFGIGKHPPSDSVFLYFLDPDGMTVEYSFGMEEFPEEGAREPRVLAPGIESSDYWGGRPDPRMGAVGVVEQLKVN